jgi:hypothetical protein
MQGTVIDGKSQKPVPGALVMAVRTGMPPLSANTRSGGGGEFQIQGLAAGTYTICVQAQGDTYLDPCQWNSNPTTVTLAAGQAMAAVMVPIATASVLIVQVRDEQNLLSAKTSDGRTPELRVGVWGGRGWYHPARVSIGPAANSRTAVSYVYRLAVPRDMPLNMEIASHDLRLGDAAGVSLAGNANTQTFQHVTGDSNLPKSFAFTVLGRLP